MKLYTTEIIAIDPLTGLLTKWCGPRIPSLSFEDAENYCQENGLGYCKITGEFICEIDENGSIENNFNYN